MKNIFSWIFLVVGLALMARSWIHKTQEVEALEKIIAQELKDHLHTKEILKATVEECGDCWLETPVSKKDRALLEDK